MANSLSKFGKFTKTPSGGYEFKCYICQRAGTGFTHWGMFTTEGLAPVVDHLLVKHPEHYQKYENDARAVRKKAGL